MAKKQAKHLADPSQLKPLEPKDGTLQVIIETPKGSRNKYAYDTEQKIFSLTKVLPAGMAFPYDFGFLPRTLAPDGDAIDVLLLMDEPAFPGCAVKSRLIGVIEGEQIDGKKRIRNDRLVAIADAYLSAGGWGDFETAEDHDLWSRLLKAGSRTRSISRMTVLTSGRRVGRAPNGFAGALIALGQVSAS